MTTYREIQDQIRMAHGFAAKPCWIAHVLSDYGLTRRQAYNRYDPDRRTNPCPPHRRSQIEESLRNLGVIRDWRPQR